MWPWGHLGIAYLLYSFYSHKRLRRTPRLEPVLAVVIGSQFADLIDKPLAWWLNIFPTGRDFGHSLLFVIIVVLVIYITASVYNRVEAATAFIIAYLSHLFVDLPRRAFLGHPFGTEFLFWPILSHDTFQYSDRLFEPPAVIELVVTPFTDPFLFFILNIILFLFSLGVWYIDGCPGIQ